MSDFAHPSIPIIAAATATYVTVTLAWGLVSSRSILSRE